MDNNAFLLNRRALMLASASAAAIATSGCSILQASDQTHKHNNQRPHTDEEKTNIELVTRFCDDWSTMDTQYLSEFLADDIVYQMFEGRPDIIGKEKFIKVIKPFMEKMRKVEWITRYSEAIGPIVINERFDHFYAHNDKRSMHFEIAGYFLIKKGKISVWRDFSLPGGISKLGPLPA